MDIRKKGEDRMSPTTAEKKKVVRRKLATSRLAHMTPEKMQAANEKTKRTRSGEDDC